MNETIGFFGASVTQQNDGYTKYLSKSMLTKHICFAYGGNHLNDAGIIFIDDVLKENLEYCFIDFFSTGYIQTDYNTIDYLDTIVYKFSQTKCKLIFLFFPRSDHIQRTSFYNFVKDYLQSKQLYYIDINDTVKYSNNLCRDTVHTTHYGSQIYAQIIYEKFKKDKSSITLPLLENLKKTKYCEPIQVLEVNKIFHKNVNLESDKCLILGFYLTIGPKSGIVSINSTKYTIWDSFCHYERTHINLRDIEIHGNLVIEVLQYDPDYSTCRRKYDFSNIRKELNILRIYYIGKSLHLNT